MREPEAAYLVIRRVHFHDNFLEIGLSLRIHPHDFEALKKWLCIEQLKASELVAKIRLSEQKHHRNPVIKRLFDGFLVDLPVSGHIEINGLTIGDEELVLRILVFPSHHPRDRKSTRLNSSHRRLSRM